MPTPRFALAPVASATLTLLLGVAAHAQSTTAPQGGTLATVTVEASADASAEGLPKPFAGGQVARGSRIGVLGNQDIMNTPFSTTSYTSELIQDQQAQSIGDVLLNDASVRQARGFGNFQQAYFIRGFVVYSDDIAYNGLYGLVPRQYMATEFVERVELFRGANAFLNGAGAGSVAGGGVGGLINVVPKRAGSEPLNRVTVGAQTGGQGYAAADISRRFGPDQSTGIRVNAARRDGGTGVSNEKQQMSALAVGLDWHSRNVRLSGDFGFQEHKLSQPRPSVTPAAGLAIPAAPDAKSNFAQPWTYSNDRDLFGTLRGEVDLNDSWTAWAAYGARHGKEENSLAAPTLTDSLGNTTAYRFDNTRKNKVQTGEIGVRGKLVTGGIQHTLTASAALFDSRERNAYGFSDFAGFSSSIYQPNAVAAPSPTYFTGGVLGSPLEVERIKTTSLALADTLSLAQDRVLLTLGLRQQTIKDTNYDYNSGAQLTTYDKSRTTPVAGVVFKATSQVALYANYIEGLVKGDTASGTNISNAGQIFAPYVSRQKEIGVKYDGGKIGASAAFFSTDKPSAYVQNGVYGVFGKQRNQGLELAAFGEAAKGLRVLGGLTLLDAKQRQTLGGATDGKDVIGVPRQQANLGVDWDVPYVHGLALNARVIHTGKQYADAANTQAVPAWTRVDVGARYLTEFNGKLLTLRARIDNLANKNYWASVGGYPGYGYLVLGAPRTFSLTASVDF
ncbi:TonB-dependent receptor [Xylophilus sp. GW821-FHT01B05]